MEEILLWIEEFVIPSSNILYVDLAEKQIHLKSGKILYVDDINELKKVMNTWDNATECNSNTD